MGKTITDLSAVTTVGLDMAKNKLRITVTVQLIHYVPKLATHQCTELVHCHRNSVTVIRNSARAFAHTEIHVDPTGEWLLNAIGAAINMKLH